MTQIPILINVRDYGSPAMLMVEYLRQIPDGRPIIVDNASTWPPLVEWLDRAPCEVVRLGENRGPRAPLTVLPMLEGVGDYYVITDADLDLSGVPLDVLDVLRGARRHGARNLRCGPAARREGLSMADLLESASDWLGNVFKQDVSQDVAYRRGLLQIVLRATLGQRQLAQVEDGGFQTVFHSTDFLFPAADLDFGNGPVEPERGDAIRLTLGGKTLTYEVLDEAGGPHFDYSDPYRTTLRVHAKQVG